jgi:hypothetical protein
MADAIYAETQLRLAWAEWLAQERLRDQIVADCRARKEHPRAIYDAGRERVRFRAEDHDIRMGNAQNALLKELARSGSLVERLPGAEVEIDSALIRRLPLNYAPGGVTGRIDQAERGQVPPRFREKVIGADPVAWRDFTSRLRREPSIPLGDLLAFLHRYHLRFGVAETPEEIAGHRVLYPRLLALADDAPLPGEPRLAAR